MSHSSPEISVVMSVYNGDPFLSDAIESILRQTFKDFEFIIINDGSRDGTSEIVHQYSKIDKRIKLVERENLGLTKSLNEGLLMARGQWIARMDADDLSHPRRFETQLSRLKKSKGDIVGSTLAFIDSRIGLKWRFPLDHESCKLRLVFKSAFGHPSIMMRAGMAQELQYDESYIQSQDYELWTRFAMAGAMMINCNQPLLFYRRHAGQVSKKQGINQRLLFDQAQKRYCEWLGIEPAQHEVITKFSGGGRTTSGQDADYLASIMCSLKAFSPASLAREYNQRLLEVTPASPSLIYKSIHFAKSVGAHHHIPPRLLIQSLTGLSTNSLRKIFQ